MQTTQIKLGSEILAALTPASPQWEKNAAYNELLQLRDSRDYFAPKLARYQEARDAEGIRMMSEAIDSLIKRIAAAEAKLSEI